MTSGFFAHSKIGDGVEKNIRRIKRILKITWYSIFLYTTITLCFRIKEFSIDEWLLQFFDWKQWVKILFISDLDIILAGHLWFLPSLIYAYLVYIFIIRKKDYKYIYKMIPILFSFRIIMSIVVTSLNLTWHLLGNFLVGALPYFFLGNYIANRLEDCRKLENGILISASMLGALTAILFTVFSNTINLSEIGTIICAVSIFLMAANNPSVSINKNIERLGESYSVYVYVLHILIGHVLGFFAQMAGWQNNVIYVWTRPIIVVVISVIASVCVYHIIENISKKYTQERKYTL